MTGRRWLVVTALALLLAGCAQTPSQSEQVIAVAAPTDAPTILEATVAATPVPTPPATSEPVAPGEERAAAPTPLAVPTGTAQDDVAEEPTPEATPVVTATATPRLEPTEEVLPTPIVPAAPTSVPTATAQATEPDTDGGSGEPVNPEIAIANGAEVYTLNCARCHGQFGTGSFQASGLIGVSARYSPSQMITELTDGHPVTFGFGDKLSAGEIADVVAYTLAAFG